MGSPRPDEYRLSCFRAVGSLKNEADDHRKDCGWAKDDIKMRKEEEGGMLPFDALILGGCMFYCLRKGGDEICQKSQAKGCHLRYFQTEHMCKFSHKKSHDVPADGADSADENTPEDPAPPLSAEHALVANWGDHFDVCEVQDRGACAYCSEPYNKKYSRKFCFHNDCGVHLHRWGPWHKEKLGMSEERTDGNVRTSS